MVISMLSTHGQSILKEKALAAKERIADQVHTKLELIFFMEEFLK